MSDGSILVLAENHNLGRCKYCHKPLVWLNVGRQPGIHKARTLPFNPQREPAPRHTDEVTGITWEHWPEAAMHRNTCTNLPKPDGTKRRFRQDSQNGQWRLL